MKWGIAYSAVLLVMILMITGCTTQGQLVYDAAVEKGEEAVDTAVQTSLRVLCLRMTKRSYIELCAGNPQMCGAMDVMCAAWYGTYNVPARPENILFGKPARYE